MNHLLCLCQWYSTGVPWHSWVPQKAQGVPPNSEFTVYLKVNCSQIVLYPRKGAANQKTVEKHWSK